MADTKQEILDMLRELAELTILDEGDPQSFRVRAYENASHAIAAQATDLGRLTVKDLLKIENVGKGTADKIRELIETGKVQKLELLRQKLVVPQGMARVWWAVRTTYLAPAELERRIAALRAAL